MSSCRMCIEMKKNVVILVVVVFYTTEALDCGIHFSRNEELQGIFNKCVNTNKTLEDLWDMAPMSSESDSSSSEEEPAVDGKMLQNFRTKRAITNASAANETEEEQSNNQSEDTTENCVIQCIFESLQMTDSTGYPAHSKILEGLLKNATNKELRDFLQDTTNECFQEMDTEETMDPCSYSVKLVTCLAEKGKSNCSDWPVGDIPFRQ